MSANISQLIIIERLNRYLKYNNLPSRMNETGICNGLALVYAKYVLEGKEQAFLQMLEAIAEMSVVPKDKQDELNYFVMQILLSFKPELYNQQLCQAQGMQLLKINGNSLESSFNFSLATSDENWVQIIQKMQLQESEVVHVASINHAIAIRKENGKYHVYDPNYASGTKEFADEATLVSELHNAVFHYDSGNLGMYIHVIRSPGEENNPREFPVITDLYAQYLPGNSNDTATIGDKKFNTLEFAARTSDTSIIAYLLDKKGIEQAFQMAINAVFCNNSSALEPLLAVIDDENQIELLFLHALKQGRYDAFQELLKNNKFKAVYEKQLLCSAVMNFAAEGGNPELLKIVIEQIKLKYTSAMMEKIQKRGTLTRLLSSESALEWRCAQEANAMIAEGICETQSTPKNAISKAISSGSRECVNILMEQLEEGDYPLTDVEKVSYLLEAIRQNKHYVALSLIDKKPLISEQAIKSISMSTRAVARTDLALLKALEKRGMLFSNAAKVVIARKEHQAVGMLAFMGLLLKTFTDFCKEVIFRSKAQGIAYTFFATTTRDEGTPEIEDNLPVMQNLSDFLGVDEENLSGLQNISELLSGDASPINPVELEDFLSEIEDRSVLEEEASSPKMQ